MQTTSLTYDTAVNSEVRELSQQLKVSWDKVFDPAVTFFTLDVSELSGPDVLAPDGGNVVQEWDKYDYEDYSDRIVALEWSRQEDVPYSVNLAIADVLLENTDDMFTRGSGSPLNDYLVPRRPIRILAGFRGQNLPQFVGLTTRAPEADRASRIAKLHAEDFLTLLFNKPLDEALMLQGVKTDEVLSELFDNAGLTSSQYVLDEAFNTIKFLYFEKGTKYGDAIRQLMQAEMGSLFMDEFGVIRFTNRLKTSAAPVLTFDSSNVIDYRTSDESKIINVVEVKAEVREVQPLQVIYEMQEKPLIPGGQSSEIFFNFEDPVTSIDSIDAYTANSLEDGTGSDLTADIDVTSTDLFSNAVKVTFENTGPDNAYLTSLSILGTPARITKKIYMRVQDDQSVEDFEEQPIEINNNFIQSDDAANSIALSLLNYYKSYGNTIELDVIGDYALQLGDTITVQVDSINDGFVVSKISNTVSKGQLRQTISARIHNIPTFFILDQSILNGDDVLAP